MSSPKTKNEDLKERIEQVLKKVRPEIQAHGGDLRLVRVQGKKATIKIMGACLGCPMAQETFGKGVKNLLKEETPEIEEIKFIT